MIIASLIAAVVMAALALILAQEIKCQRNQRYIQPLLPNHKNPGAIGDASLWGIFPKRGEG